MNVFQNNATGETQGAFANTTSPYFDSLYCRCVAYPALLIDIIDHE